MDKEIDTGQSMTIFFLFTQNSIIWVNIKQDASDFKIEQIYSCYFFFNIFQPYLGHFGHKIN